MMFLSKAYSLKKISNYNNNLVPRFFYFKKIFFLKNKSSILKKIKNKFNTDIIIRSSALNEDSLKKSNAGFYDSFIILKKDFDQIENKILKLIKKFKNNDDQILVQKFIQNPQIAGVIFTKDKTSNSHYFDINYDTSGKSNLITSGKYNPSIKSLSIYKNSNNVPTKFRKLINISKKLEKLFNNDRLDIEFCIKNNNVFILQCRPLLGPKKNVDNEKLNQIIINLEAKFNKINQINETLLGDRTVLSTMSDWNPAEMIGKKPSQLASSLYAELITNSIWAEQRYNYGYKDVNPNKLMLNFAGTPYIDLRVDLNSFLPANLNSSISRKLINFFINKIKKNPELHDKIEFELINTCFDFTLAKDTSLPLSKSEKEIYVTSLKNLTNKILNPKNNFLKNDINKVITLKKKISLINKSKLSHIQKIFYLVNDCKRYGTLPFAGIARCAFISKTILDSLQKINYISTNDIENFYLTINTISKKINNEYYNSGTKNTFKKFIENYGHLRPSTYSILTKNYKDNYKNYFSKDFKKDKSKNKTKFQFNKVQIKKIDKLFKKNDLSISFNQFLKFAKESIENREYSKLIFTKSIDEIFINLNKLAKEINIDIKKFQHLDIDVILKSFNNLEQERLRKIIARNININNNAYKFSQYLNTPDVITNSRDFYFFHSLNSRENYITKKTKIGEIALLNNFSDLKSVSKKIVLIENADPGFDFLFSYNIEGLITKYGGSNSHMAIRCMELGLPAIIGIGDKIYNQLSKSKKIFIDCNNKKFTIIH
jgi:phosphohistidine swiveling domain-containing protein